MILNLGVTRRSSGTSMHFDGSAHVPVLVRHHLHHAHAYIDLFRDASLCRDLPILFAAHCRAAVPAGAHPRAAHSVRRLRLFRP